ncbi:hypothetical protein A2933_00530 [Candidatus Nomurabacteria bacterium RIFCSPLOWO2_01_FULL_46_18]|uniref:Aminotransferase class V domain-containing protein n=1 Tax=Candidatus Nomurabacteria bacterium RIFCSPLOWO2_01_FULL_46_18 TaxID=1801783 RepID=A0A1F6XE98_9BACT|nr:MAG: hypothetical protein A2933_00530 [Candidatus Nomurabacteria bacterium RIFCSPLOWO2_01_FULL_46_18]
MLRKARRAGKIYLDYASGSFPNPNAIHELGKEEKRKLEDARTRIARVLGAHSDEIIFTSGATESNNLAILGAPRGHLVTTNIEHASVLESCKQTKKVTYVEVEKNGIVDSKKIRKAFKPNTVLVSVMYANNEIGTIQPIREIAKEIRHFRKRSNLKNSKRSDLGTFPYFHTDATQAVNYLPIKVEKLGVDLMSFNSAKIYGPKGIGALYKKRNVRITPLMWGGNQERGLRPGTENVEGAVALARALEQVEKIKDKEVKRLTKLRDYFLNKLEHSHILKNVGILVNGDWENRLPNNLNISIPKIPSDLLVIELSARGIMASAKSACKSGEETPSHVIAALRGKAADEGSLRFSLGRETSKKDIDRTVKALDEIFKKLEKWYN